MYEPVIKETINTNDKAVTGLEVSQGTPDAFVKAIAHGVDVSETKYRK